jgi:hypothetical protein
MVVAPEGWKLKADSSILVTDEEGQNRFRVCPICLVPAAVLKMHQNRWDKNAWSF